jgi:hypothetical protein
LEVVNVQKLLEPHGENFVHPTRYSPSTVASLIEAARINIGIFAELYPPAKDNANSDPTNYTMRVFLEHANGSWQNIAFLEFPIK